jgi:hypothetical protein
MERREYIALSAFGAAASTAGCLGVLLGNEPVSKEADQATVGSSALEDSGYEKAAEREETITREFDVPGGTREAEATNKIVEYDRAIEVGTERLRAAVFATLSTPAFEFGGETFNPIDDMRNREIAKMAQGQYSGLSVGDEVDERTVETLEDEVDLSKFEASGTVGGEQVPAFLHVGKVRHGDDFVVPLAIYPRRLSDEESVVVGLIESLEH